MACAMFGASLRGLCGDSMYMNYNKQLYRAAFSPTALPDMCAGIHRPPVAAEASSSGRHSFGGDIIMCGRSKLRTVTDPDARGVRFIGASLTNEVAGRERRTFFFPISASPVQKCPKLETTIA